MKYLTGDEILSSPEPTDFTDVPTPELAPSGTDAKECFVRVRALSYDEADTFSDGNYIPTVDDKGAVQMVRTGNQKARLVALAAVDEKGNRIFTDDAAIKLGKKRGPAIAAFNRIYLKALDISGLSGRSQAAIEKNSETGQG